MLSATFTLFATLNSLNLLLPHQALTESANGFELFVQAANGNLLDPLPRLIAFAATFLCALLVLNI